MRDTLNLVDSEDAWEVAEMSGSRPVTTRVKYRTSGHSTSCAGIHLSFPSGRNEHTPYTFGLHPQPPVPWNYHSSTTCSSFKQRFVGGAWVLLAEEFAPLVKG
ncbi:hypothetical protein K443DRAFT_403417 [Laccaria amethystina LaAM-08-1]|uniref:Unplaced genomic scaffold K443scaffold_318, whole genome shotgun sequence n=1 Tax=Laccaria amethystina LaAM-08-1 TaxID=1095629 RepID=A0A0C9X6J7_9AGAR|nr:hypothetical protein K443DRAFT_403417 [Laccaria amethystina LaAM-08-1]